MEQEEDVVARPAPSVSDNTLHPQLGRGGVGRAGLGIHEGRVDWDQHIR